MRKILTTTVGEIEIKFVRNQGLLKKVKGLLKKKSWIIFTRRRKVFTKS